MTDVATPDSSIFSVNEKPREYTAYIKVEGIVEISVEADSPEEARRLAEAEVEKIENDGYVEVDRPDVIELERVRKDAPMYRVIREGKMMQVSHLDPGDLPRQPDERGF
jgi:hypothetical protein